MAGPQYLVAGGVAMRIVLTPVKSGTISPGHRMNFGHIINHLEGQMVKIWCKTLRCTTRIVVAHSCRTGSAARDLIFSMASFKEATLAR